MRVADHIWDPAMSTAQEQGEPLSTVIRRALESYVAEHVGPRLVRIEQGREVFGVDPLTVRAVDDQTAATAYLWSQPKQTYGKRPRAITLTADQAELVQR